MVTLSLFILCVAFALLFIKDKLQTAAALPNPAYKEKNPLQVLIWKLVKKDPDRFIQVNFMVMMIPIAAGGVIYGAGGITWTCAYFGVLDALFVYVVIHNKKILPKAA
jgi:hypothetical protein